MSLKDKEARRLYNIEYHKKNKEKIKLQREEFRLKNKKKLNETQNEYYRNLSKEDKEIRLEKRKAYYRKNKEQIKKNCELYRKRTRKTHGLKQTGSYNIKIAERNKEQWINEILNVYKFKMIDTDGTIFYKIGLTNNISNRIRQIPYEVELIKSVELDKYESVYLEKSLLKDVLPYIPLIKFSGYTECFI